MGEVEYFVDFVDVSVKRDFFSHPLADVDRIVGCHPVLSPIADGADVHYCSGAMYLLDFDDLFLLMFSSWQWQKR